MFSEEYAIRAQGLGKCYHIYDRPQDRLKQAIIPRCLSFFGKKHIPYYREFWALQDLSFDIARGETVGIIGRNGSGKSTLLQMICGTLTPTTGEVKTQGRIAALLELGAGFNPEFTGRENVYMNGAILGLSKKEMDEKFNEIAAFAEIGEFIEQPVKCYSSGMYARLAFAVAINVDPDILIVDEALAVGDEPFQRKCFAKIDAIKKGGGTILFVSHASSAIVSLCDRAMVLSEGKRVYIGEPKKAVAIYQKLVNSKVGGGLAEAEAEGEASVSNELPVEGDSSSTDKNPVRESAESGGGVDEFYDPGLVSKSCISYERSGAEILNCIIRNSDGVQVNHLVKGRRYSICGDVRFDVACSSVRFYSIIKNIHGIELGGGTYPTVESECESYDSGRVVRVKIEFDCSLRPDMYFINFGVASDGVLVHRVIDFLAFRVLSYADSSSIGIVDFNASSACELLGGDQ